MFLALIILLLAPFAAVSATEKVEEVSATELLQQMERIREAGGAIDFQAPEGQNLTVSTEDGPEAIFQALEIAMETLTSSTASHTGVSLSGNSGTSQNVDGTFWNQDGKQVYTAAVMAPLGIAAVGPISDKTFEFFAQNHAQLLRDLKLKVINVIHDPNEREKILDRLEGFYKSAATTFNADKHLSAEEGAVLLLITGAVSAITNPAVGVTEVPDRRSSGSAGAGVVGGDDITTTTGGGGTFIPATIVFLAVAAIGFVAWKAWKLYGAKIRRRRNDSDEEGAEEPEVKAFKTA